MGAMKQADNKNHGGKLRGLLLAAILCLSPSARACDSCAATVAAVAATSTLVGIITANTAALTLAIGAAGGGIASNLTATAAATFDAQKSAVEHEGITKKVIADKMLAAQNTVNTENLSCRLGTRNTLLAGTKQVAASVRKTNEQSLLNLIYHPNYTPMRLSISHIYRLCQNGQLTPEVFGQKWFNDNQCIDNPRTAHDYLKTSTILDSSVLVPPTQAQMDILNNPEANTPAQVQSTFTALNDKQKKYVGAIRYCENLVIARLLTQTIRNNDAAASKNAAAIGQNMGANASVALLADACNKEVARRTALDPNAPGGMSAGPYRTKLQDNGKKIIDFLVNKRGYDPRLVYAYATDADYDNNNPIGGSANPQIFISDYLLERYSRDYSLSIKCVNYGDTGTDAVKTKNALACAQNAANYDLAEVTNNANFIAAVSDIGGTGQFNGSTGTPVKPANYMAPDDFGTLQEATLAVPGGTASSALPLATLLQTFDPPRQVERVAAPPQAQP